MQAIGAAVVITAVNVGFFQFLKDSDDKSNQNYLL